jgi:hypothetical protein
MSDSSPSGLRVRAMTRLREMRWDRASVLARCSGAARIALRYGPIAVLVFAFVHEVVWPFCFTERPRPSAPPDGWESESLAVDLLWARGDAQSVELEVSESPDFSKRFFDQSIRGTRHRLVGLSRGRKYYWRLEKGSGAVVANFRTSPRAIAF